MAVVNTNLVLGSMSHLYRLSYCAEGQYQKRKKTKTITKSVRKNANDIDCFYESNASHTEYANEDSLKWNFYLIFYLNVLLNFFVDNIKNEVCQSFNLFYGYQNLFT